MEIKPKVRYPDQTELAIVHPEDRTGARATPGKRVYTTTEFVMREVSAVI
jgi:hypothetical protein